MPILHKHKHSITDRFEGLANRIKEIEASVAAHDESCNVRIAQCFERLAALEGKRPPAKAEWMSSKALAVEAGCVGDKEAISMLKYWARKYSTEHGLQVRRGEGDKKTFEYFHPDAAAYAIEQFKAK